MLENDLKEIWNNSSKTSEIAIETNLLKEELNASLQNIHKKIKYRDIREISASVVGILIFGYLFFEIPFPLTKIACVLTIVWFLFVLLKYRKSKIQNSKIDFDLPLAEQLKLQKNLMLKQANLLDTALYWYAIPPFILNFLFILGLGNPSDFFWENSVADKLLPLSIDLKIITLIGLALFYTYTFSVNKNALNRDVQPLLESIEKIEKQVNTFE